MIKRLFIPLVYLIMLTVLAAPRMVLAAESNGAELRLICALSSMASYEDDNGILVRDMLKNYGWSIEPISDETSKANAKALIVSKQSQGGSLIKILAVCGTSEIKDAEVDLRLHKVPTNFDSKSNAADGSNSGDNTADDSKVLVHQGFKDYSEVILNNELGNKLFKELAENPSEHLYVTGHSLGGAVAILTAAKLIDLGVPANNIEVITFGAPAVGNKGFANEYKDKIRLTRVTMSGDPIKKSLQALGYVHFGEVKKYNQNNKIVKHFPHKMAVYLDCAIRDYYDEKFSTNVQINNPATKTANFDSIYIAPIQIMKDSFNKEDFKYIKAAMRDQMRLHLPTAIYDETEYREVEEIDELAKFDNTIADTLNKAKAMGCKYVLVHYLQAKKIRDDRDSNYRISLEEIRYDLKGFPTSMQTASVTTTELTTIEAVIFALENLNRKEE